MRTRKQAHPVLKYRFPHGSQPRHGWAPDPPMVGIRSPIGLVVGSCPATLEFGFDSQTRGTRENRRTLCESTGFLTGPKHSSTPNARSPRTPLALLTTFGLMTESSNNTLFFSLPLFLPLPLSLSLSVSPCTGAQTHKHMVHTHTHTHTHTPATGPALLGLNSHFNDKGIHSHWQKCSFQWPFIVNILGHFTRPL